MNMAISASVDGGDRLDAAGPPLQPQTEKTSTIPLARTITVPKARRNGGVGETHDDYPDVVTVLDGGKTRVIVCYAGIQWIVQHKRGDQWHSRSFCRTKEALLRCCGQDPHPALAGLPDRIDKGAG
jgi:hypothetical protein